MMIKYRVSEVAKDFGVPSKDVIELLAKYVDTPKKSATALEENELDLVTGTEFFAAQPVRLAGVIQK